MTRISMGTTIHSEQTKGENETGIQRPEIPDSGQAENMAGLKYFGVITTLHFKLWSLWKNITQLNTPKTNSKRLEPLLQRKLFF